MKITYLSVLFTALLYVNATYSKVQAQQPTANIHTLSGDITIDGIPDEQCWDSITAIEIDVNHLEDEPSVSASWKAAWTTQGLFICVEGEDDIWAPSWETELSNWQSDNIEVSLDFSNPQKDGKGGIDGLGNYAFYFDFQEFDTNLCVYREAIGGEGENGSKCYYASDYNGEGNYSMEYFIPADQLFVYGYEDGTLVDLKENTVIGFDAGVVDTDYIDGTERQRKFWANSGSTDESWNNMDDVGLVTLLGDGEEVDITLNVDDCTDTVHVKRTICQGELYNFYGQNLSMAGVYYHTAICSTVELTLFVANGNYSDTTVVDTSICAPNEYNFFGEQLMSSGTYFYGQNCSDITQLNLTVHEQSFTSIYPVIFKGQSYEGHTQSGLHQKKLVNSMGCDSLLSIYLGVIETIPSEVVVSVNTVFITVVDSKNAVTVRETSGELYVKMYPNPADVFLNLSAEQIIEEVYIVDMRSSVVLGETINAKFTNIDISSISPGSYIVELRFSYGTVSKILVVE